MLREMRLEDAEALREINEETAEGAREKFFLGL